MEYSLIKRRYSGSEDSVKRWSRRADDAEPTSSRRGASVLTTVAKTLNLQYARHDNSLVMVHDPLGVLVYDTKTSTLSKERNMYQHRVSVMSH